MSGGAKGECARARYRDLPFILSLPFPSYLFLCPHPSPAPEGRVHGNSSVSRVRLCARVSAFVSGVKLPLRDGRSRIKRPLSPLLLLLTPCLFPRRRETRINPPVRCGASEIKLLPYKSRCLFYRCIVYTTSPSMYRCVRFNGIRERKRKLESRGYERRSFVQRPLRKFAATRYYLLLPLSWN